MRETSSPAEIYRVINSEYSSHNNGARIPASVAVIAVGVVLKESGGDTGAINVVSSSGAANGSRDRGWWQFNSYWHPEISDSVAFDKVSSTREAYRVSNGFTSWGAWFGGGASSITAEFNRNQHNQAAYNIAVRTVSATPGGGTVSGFGSSGSGSTDPNWGVIAPLATPGELRLLKKWGIESNGWRIVRSSNQDSYQILTDDEFKKWQDIVARHVKGDGTLIAGWLLEAKLAAGLTTEMVLNSDYEDALRDLLSARQNRYGGPDPSLLDQVAQAVDTGSLSAITGDIGSVISSIWGAVSNVSFWKRIGLGALGVLIILMAIIVFTAKEVKA